MDVFGAQVTISALSADDYLSCQQRGFDIASGGESAIRQWLSGFYECRVKYGRTVGPNTHFAALYDWLAKGTADLEFRPLRKIIAEYCFDTMPGQKPLFGFKPQSAKVHSIHSAASQYGLHPTVLRKLLLLTNVLDKEAEALSDDHAVFDAVAGDIVINRFLHSVSAEEAAEYLNVERPLKNELLGGKYLPPLVQSRPDCVIHAVYEKSVLDRFLKQLMIDASPVLATEKDFLPLVEASRRACCGAMEIIDLLLTRRLRKVRLSDGDRGIQAIRVDLKEVRHRVRLADHGGLSLREVESELGTSTGVVKALVANGILKSRTALNPVNRCPQTVVDQEGLAGFKSEFISLARLAGERKIPLRRLKKQLADIPVAFDRNQIGATFFRRSSLPT